ncbi:MAG: hypothetical protein NVS3B2_17580 [Ramlibacter sp.]
MHQVVFLDRATVAPQIGLRRPNFEHRFMAHACTAPDEVAERLDGASIAITNKAPITAASLERLPELRRVRHRRNRNALDDVLSVFRGKIKKTGSFWMLSVFDMRRQESQTYWQPA